MSDDSGALSIDFLVGFTIFIIAFIWVVSIIPGLLIGLQSYTIDYDAVAYRTGVILVEDPGEPLSWEVAPYGEAYDQSNAQRFGLALSREDPNILSPDKVNRFFDTTIFNEPDYGDYRTRSVFGNYPYRFNISFRQIGNNEANRSVGEVLPEGYGYILRFVKIKSMSNAIINGSNIDPKFINGDNETTHIFSIVLNNTNLIGKASQIKDPAYQIIPARESFMINLTNLNSTMGARKGCFNISLNSIVVSDDNLTIPYTQPIIDGVPRNTPYEVMDNISLPYDTTNNRNGLNWEAPQIKISLIFNLLNGICGPGITGSQFLNNTATYPFDYDYNPANVTQPQLRDAVVEVAIW